MAKLYDILQGLINTDSEVIAKIKNKFASLDSSVENLISNLNSLRSDVSFMDESIDDLLERTEGLTGNNAEIIDKVDDLVVKSEDFSGDIADLNATTDKLIEDTNKLTDITNDLIEKTTRGFSTFAIVDKDTPGLVGLGSPVSDVLASKGECYHYLTTGTAQTIYTATFPEVNFGHYSLCVRLRVDKNTSSSSILSLNVSDGTSSLLGKAIKGTDFESNSRYCYLCTTFVYDANSAGTKSPLKFELVTTTVSNVNVYFDYAYITLITPAIYA